MVAVFLSLVTCHLSLCTALKILSRLFSNAGISASGIMFGPSLNARSGLRMRFDEKAVRARRQRGAGQHRRKFALAGRFVAAAAGQLHGMRRVKNHREPEALHDWNRAHVGHEIVVAERRAALGEQDFFAPARRAFSTTCPISAGERNWPFFRFTIWPVSTAASIKSVWRQRNAGICRMSTTSPATAAWVSVWMSVSTGTPIFSRTLASISQAVVQARPAKGFGRRAVGLVEAGLEDVKDAELRRRFS